MSAVERIISWANEGLPEWQVEAVRRFLTQTEFTADDEDAIYLMALAANGLIEADKAPKPMPLDLSSVPGAPASSARITLEKITVVSGVNRIPAGAELPLSSEGLTVVFGRNGAGKSGYARVLKRACRARDTAEPVLPNVFDATPRVAAANIAIVEEGKGSEELAWQFGKASDPRLASISVFDTHSARVILNQKNEVEYLPYGTEVFGKLVSLLQKIRERLKEDAPLIPEVTDSQIVEGTRAHQWLNALTSASDDKAAECVLTWSTDEEEFLKGLHARIAELRADNRPKRLGEVQQTQKLLQNLSSQVSSIAVMVSDKGVENAIELVAKERALKEAADELAREAKQLEVVNGAGQTDKWRELYQAARSFSIESAYPDVDFPNTDDNARCVFCLQHLSEEAKSRLRQFKGFMESDISTKLEQARQEIRKKREALRNVSFPSEEVVRLALRQGGPESGELVSHILNSISSSRESISLQQQLLSGVEVSPFSVSFVSCNQQIAEYQKDIERQMVELSESVDTSWLEYSEKLAAALSAWKALAKRKLEVIARLNALKGRDKYLAASASIQPGAVTRSGRAITDEVLTPELVSSLQEELRRIGWTRVGVQLRTEGREGNTLTVLGLNDAKLPKGVALSQVLSEGEQRALAIAGFLAELRASGTNHGVVFDDPVSSLDHVFSRRIAQRLVQEALQRQVVVFTHSLALLMELGAAVEEARKKGQKVVSENVTIERGRLPGTARKGHPWEGLSTGQRADLMKQRLAKIKHLHDENIEVYNEQVANIYGRLREAWESFVEKDLLGEVVTRYRVSVQTLRLWEVEINHADVHLIDRAMAKTSRFMIGHDDSLEISTDRPAPDEVLADIEELAKFSKDVRGRYTDTKKARKAALSV